MGAVGGRDGAPRALAGGRIASSRRHPIVKPMVKTGQRAAQGEGCVSRPAHIVETRNFALHFLNNDLKGCMTRAAPVAWCHGIDSATDSPCHQRPANHRLLLPGTWFPQAWCAHLMRVRTSRGSPATGHWQRDTPSFLSVSAGEDEVSPVSWACTPEG